jgi:hypothetical protein
MKALEELGFAKSYKVVPGKVSQSRTGLKAKSPDS